MICRGLRENSLPNHKKVIPFRQSGGPRNSQEKWQFSDYAGFEEWYQELSEEGQDTFDSVLKTNGNTPIPKHWNSSKMLQGEYKQEGLWEWCFFADGCQQRVIGVFGKKRQGGDLPSGLYPQAKDIPTSRMPEHSAQTSKGSPAGKGEAKWARG